MRDLTLRPEAVASAGSARSHCEGPEAEGGRQGAAVTPALLWRPVCLHSPLEPLQV